MLKSDGRHAFGDFVLDPGERSLTRSGRPVELNSRYFDALALLAGRPGELIAKERFMAEVWQGVPVTDEALTQCIRTLRKTLGDDASHPRFIETVPKHGYRFIADVREQGGAATAATGRARAIALLTGAGTIGGGLAGLAGGTLYGVAAAFTSAGQQVGGVSILLVLMCVTIAVALIGAAGVSLGIASALAASTGFARMVAGGAIGGLVVGLAAKLVMIDSFRILFSRSPGDITGALEGLILGGAVGVGAWVAAQAPSLRRGVAAAAACGAGGGLVIALLGRPLMAGSLARLAEQLPGSRLNLSAIAALAGEERFGPLASAATATLEGALFAGAIVLAMRLMEFQNRA